MYALFLALFALAAAGAAAQAPLASSAVAPAPVAQPAPPLVTTGLASWYGWQFHGRATASGEDYDMYAMTAAHRTLPFDTLVRVSLIDGSEGVDVRINDRQPFVDGRIIDLSLGAARELGMLRSGVAQVELQVLHLPPPQRYILQIGSFSVPDNAHDLLHWLRGWDIAATLEPFEEFTRVVTAPATETELPAIEQRLRAAGIGTWVRRGCSEPRAGDSPGVRPHFVDGQSQTPLRGTPAGPPTYLIHSLGSHPSPASTRRPCPSGV